MAEKFNPAPHDKHAADPNEAAQAETRRDNWKAPAEPDAEQDNDPHFSLWDKVKAAFR